MPETKRIPKEQLTRYFDDFSRRFLMDESPEAVDIELISAEWGDQLAASGVRLLGLGYDPHTNAFEIELESGDHRVYEPSEVWVTEESDGFISALEIVAPDGSRQVVSIRRVGLGRST